MRVLTWHGLASTKVATAVGVVALAGAAVTALAAPATAATAGARPTRGAAQVVLVQTDGIAGNQVVAYDRAVDGTLTLAGSYDTGGLGGVLTGSVVDHLASQGSLTYDPRHGLVYAVNAGSDTVSVFCALGDRLVLRQVIGSGGTFPVSVAVHGEVVYVLNALDGGSVQGFRVSSGRLVAIPGSTRHLGLDPAATPQFTHTPGQVAFSPDGAHLIVTTKANGEDIDVFALGAGGLLSDQPVVNAEPGTVPFAIAFDPAGHLVIANAGTNALATYSLGATGVLTALDAVGTGQKATCWVAAAGSTLFASNAGSANVSGYRSDSAGGLTLLGQTGTDPGTVDAAATPDGRFLYVQAGATGIVDEFAIGADGSLTSIGSVAVAGAAGAEGIIAV
jgi:DNA-binding beta-propeller fold protein YncE